jgi:hypothetical protein
MDYGLLMTRKFLRNNIAAESDKAMDRPSSSNFELLDLSFCQVESLSRKQRNL